jgi:hypothetical protein
MSHAWTHSWCKSPSRDEAVRASEDNRTGPLPTLADVIAEPFADSQGKCESMIPKTVSASSAVEPENKGNGMRPPTTKTATVENDLAGVTKRRPPDPRGGGNVTGHADTGANTGDRGWHRKQWDDAVGIICDGGSWGRGNSFDVAKIGALMIWADKEMRQTVGLRSMLDAAIRERDKLRAERITQALTADRFAAAVAEADALKASVAELERLSRQRAAATLARVDELEHRGRESYSRGWNAAITREREAEKASKQQQATAETALESAPAASNSSEILTSSPAASGAAGTEPVAWAILRGGHFIVATVNEVAANESCKDYGGTVVPLYAAPQPAKGWLTEEQREAVAFAARKLRELANQQYRNGDEATATDTSREADFVDGILARSTPPEVVLPPFKDEVTGGPWAVAGYNSAIEVCREAIAAAGVPWKEVG